jgi:hypothetical protein
MGQAAYFGDFEEPALFLSYSGQTTKKGFTYLMLSFLRSLPRLYKDHYVQF